MKRIILVRKPEADEPNRGYAYRIQGRRRASFWVTASHLQGKEAPESLVVEKNYRGTK